MGVQPLMAGKNVYFALYCSCMNISKHRICYFKYTKLILVAKGKKPHTRLESVGSSNVSVVTTSAAPPPPPHARKEEEIVIIIYEEEQ